MKKQSSVWLVGLTLISSSMLFGCSESEQTAETTQANTTLVDEVNDNDVTTNVETALYNNQQLQNLAIKVTTTKGDVLLTGEVDNQYQFNAVEALTQSIKGVHTVHNHLTIRE